MVKTRPGIGSCIFFILVVLRCHGQFNNGRSPSKSSRRGHWQPAFPPAKLHPCEQSSCYPATGNLLIGRESQLTASSTCGLYDKERFCIVSHLENENRKNRQKQKDKSNQCFFCDSRPASKPNPAISHNISNIVYRTYPGTRQMSWWQSENGKENVYIQLDLEAEFHFTHLIITFKSFRPSAMLIERSYDFGKTWQVYRYFAARCSESFPNVTLREVTKVTDVICESRYSGVSPSTGGEVIFRVLPPNVAIENPFEESIQNQLKMTNLRINFTKLHTLGDDLLDRRQDIQEKYYYAISDMVVRGSCSCYGHASRCLPLAGIAPKADMVHGRCECTHNTKGRNCEKCEDFFNDLPWKPAFGSNTHACKRCNCNNHATSCHFDTALYEATGKITGGVCDGCQHNTQGPNCEQCKPFFYKDPSRDIQDPEVCRPCDCDPHGSLDGGICDSITDTENSLEAGHCHCKINVEGRRCDTCKNGFWNFTEVNPEGCQSCTCNTLGTIDNQGCNQYTGECTCKRNVQGRDCNQCYPETWGLSEKKDGCSACECDIGGAIDNNCDVITGQCRCRPNMTGRKCDMPEQLFYIANLDYMLYEAELARNTSNSQVVIKEPPPDGRATHTGSGYLKAFESSHFTVEYGDIKKTGDYNVVIRYEPSFSGQWQEVLVTLARPDYPDPNGPCAGAPKVETRLISLPNARSYTIEDPFCLEEGLTYTITIEFRRYDYGKETPTASILIDSVVLLPSMSKIPWFDPQTPGGLKRLREFQNNQCNLQEYYRNPSEAPEICREYYRSIGAYIHGGGKPCSCDPTGSRSKLCLDYGGSCECKPNVVGRKCDRCAPGHYGFGPEGCKPCECHSVGALDNFCNVTTGQCKCRANAYGRECNQCRTGFWNFPNCIRCDCNGHAETCQSLTGECISCKDSTTGHTCERCIDGFYGDPRFGIDIPCRPCPCPGYVSQNHSFAAKCVLDPLTKDPICACNTGYSGSKCDICSDNYFGNPEQPGGSCQLCDCSDKIDVTQPGNCDPHTGQCKKCLYETAGDHCEVCRPGTFRYTPDSMCIECDCNGLGKNQTAGPCNPEGGQCPCLPNVQGLSCNSCIENHWKIASGEGCEACDCDPTGSLHQQCNEYDGQCVCKEGFGGRQCNECREYSYGDPKKECKRCQCDRSGSKTMQCDRKTGACVCHQGIGGYHCDTCARGYNGIAPNCAPCGECFDNWDRILQETFNKTKALIDRAGDIKKVGARGAYTTEFDRMQKDLNEIEQLLNNTNAVNVTEINEGLRKLKINISNIEELKSHSLDASLANLTQTILLENFKVDDFKARLDQLNQKIKDLESNGTSLQEDNVQGALNLIKNANTKANNAAQKAEKTREDVDFAERQCKAAENLVNETQVSFKKSLENNKMKLENITKDLSRLKSNLPDLNHLICDGMGDPCDTICGGAGCSSCGGSISCENGAKQQAEAAISIANSTETALRNKEATANDFIRNVSIIDTSDTKKLAQAAYDEAERTFNGLNTTLDGVQKLKDGIKEFLEQNSTKPETLKAMAKDVLAKEINLSKDELEKLAEDIKKIVDSLTNTEAIIEATKDDLFQVNRLKDDAKNTKDKATQLHTDAMEVKKALSNSTKAQQEAEEAINKALNDTNTVDIILNKIKEKTEEAQKQTGNTAESIQELKEKLNQLQQNITNNGIDANRVINESASILSNAKSTYENFNSLQVEYRLAKTNLETNMTNVKSLKERSDTLFTRAVNILSKVTQTEDAIQKLQEVVQQDPTSLENQLELLHKQLNDHIELIRGRSQYYDGCN